MKLAELINLGLRPFSMYRGLLMGLLGVWFVALLLAFIGQLGFSSIELAVSTAALITGTYGASLLCGWLFGVRPQLDSSLITALILSFIFTPSAEVPQLVVLVFAGVIAGASKFVVTWRGRHIFNPAALAAFVLSIAGLAGAAWWVATPILTPIVLMVVLVSLYQSKRYIVVGTFLAIAIPVLLIQFLLFGATFTESAWLLLSWPVLFLAGIMLTEPLTLPPKKWQMCVVAAVVAVLFVLPLKIGSFVMTPALALLAGNIIAAVFAARQSATLTLKKRTPLTSTTEEFVFEPSIPLKFEPGQYMEIALPHKRADMRGARRRFSITSLESDKEIKFGIKFYEPSSTFKRTLKTLEKGATLRMVNLEGDFTLPKDASRPLLFIAGGIGITPFVSHLRYLESLAEKRNVELVYAVNDPKEIAYKDVLQKSGIRVVVVAPEKPKDLPKNWGFEKSARIDFDSFETLVPDVSDRWAYVSGPTPFVQNAKRQLRKLRAKGIKTDYFAGY